MSKQSNIWVIDDDRSIRWVLERALKQADMNVTTFENANGVLERLSSEIPDAIVSDIRVLGVYCLEHFFYVEGSPYCDPYGHASEHDHSGDQDYFPK